MGLKGKIIVGRKKLVKTIKEQLIQGVTPQKLAITVMLGVIFGIIPVLGVNVVILAFIALRLRLNSIIIQIVNFAFYPLQILLLVPFFKAGQWIFRTENPVSLSDFTHLFSANFFHTASEFSFVILKGITVWFLLSIPIGFLVYSVFVMFFKSLLVQIARKRR